MELEFANSFRAELRPMLRLAVPLIVAEIGWMSMGIVDTMMVGRLPNSAEAIGAASIGNALFYTVGVFGSGMLLGLDTVVSRAFGAREIEECHQSLFSGVYLSLLLAPLLMGFIWINVPFLSSWGLTPVVLRDAVPYLRAVTWGTLPLLLFFAQRRYLQGMSVVKPVTFALISANLVNLAGNWILVFGHWGAPRMGVPGSGWATCFSRSYMALFLFGYIIWHDRRHCWGLWQTRLAPHFASMLRLLRLGLPAATQLTLEMAVFAVATAMIARIGAVPLAAHQIAMNMAALAYMVPLGIGSAAAVRVGQALGRRDPRGASRAGWSAVMLGAGFMSCTAVAFCSIPGPIIRVFSSDVAVVATGTTLLLIAGVFQLFDGIQTVTTGALRGAGDTRTPMLSFLLGYWLIGLPLGYFLCFSRGWGAPGLWTGLCVALILIGIFLLRVWQSKVRSLAAAGQQTRAAAVLEGATE
jgi:MATE family multidrug resistance protein